MKVTTLEIRGIQNENIARVIQQAVHRHAGVQLCSIGIESDQAHVVFDEQRTSIGRLQKLIEQIGYPTTVRA